MIPHVSFKRFSSVIRYNAALLASALLLAAVTVAAFPSPAISNSDKDMLAFSLGYFDAFDDNEAFDARLEYRFGRPLIYDIRPWLGIEITSDGAAYGAGGLRYDWNFADNFYIVPSLGAGIFSDGGGKDLGTTLQFRTQIEFQIELKDASRFSFAFSHISNCHLSDDNPGTEILSLYYSIPLEKIF